MKKILLLISLLAGAFALLTGINTLHDERGVNGTSVSKDGVSTVHAVKYKDCISQEDFSEIIVSKAGKEMTKSGWGIIKVDSSIAKYKKSMDKAIKNLNYIDAHNFIHQEFQRSKTDFFGRDLSEIQKHYHLEIMRICYESDKALSLGSVSRL